MSLDKKNIFAVIMAGGRGERFWPAGRRDVPKQLVSISGKSTMIEDTCQRLFPLFAPENILVITNEAFVDKMQKLLPIPPENIVGEPVGRDTAPCVALAAALIKRRCADATMVLLPADHLIKPAKQFQDILVEAIEAAAAGALVTLGIKPHYPADCYGYIEAGEKVFKELNKVKCFREKPDKATAETFLKAGNFFWNAGIFVWKVESIEREFAENTPELSTFISELTVADDVRSFLEENFSSCPKIPIDYAVMEKAANVMVREVDFFWNDIGCWSALKKVFPIDNSNNAVSGNAVLLDTANSVVKSDKNMMIGVIGMNDIAVIQSGNGVLVCPLQMQQKVKKLVQILPENWK